MDLQNKKLEELYSIRITKLGAKKAIELFVSHFCRLQFSEWDWNGPEH